MRHKATSRLGLAFIAAAVLVTVAARFQSMKWEREFTLLDQPMRVIANRTVTNTFLIPTNASYAIDVYVQATVPYADCLLGQGGYLEERCSPYRRVIDVVWVVHSKDGSVLRKGLSGGTCCDYTSDGHDHGVVSTMLGAFQLPAGTTAYLELRHRRDISKLHGLSPRIVIERYDPEESELGVQAWSFLGTGALLLIGLALLMKAWFQYRAARV